MLVAAPGFVFRVCQAWWRLIRRRRLPVAASVLKLLRFLYVSPGFITRFLPHLLLWFSPWYHPARHDDEDARIVARYAAELAAKKEVQQVASASEAAGDGAAAADTVEAAGVIVLRPDDGGFLDADVVFDQISSRL